MRPGKGASPMPAPTAVASPAPPLNLKNPGCQGPTTAAVRSVAYSPRGRLGLLSFTGEPNTTVSCHRGGPTPSKPKNGSPGCVDCGMPCSQIRGLWVYVNNLGEEGEGQVKAACGKNDDRLVALKNKYDPANFFRLNQNAKPTA